MSPHCTPILVIILRFSLAFSRKLVPVLAFTAAAPRRFLPAPVENESPIDFVFVAAAVLEFVRSNLTWVCGRIVCALAALPCLHHGQSDLFHFEPGFGAYQGLAQKINVPFSRIFSFFLQF